MANREFWHEPAEMYENKEWTGQIKFVPASELEEMTAAYMKYVKDFQVLVKERDQAMQLTRTYMEANEKLNELLFTHNQAVELLREMAKETRGLSRQCGDMCRYPDCGCFTDLDIVLAKFQASPFYGE